MEWLAILIPICAAVTLRLFWEHKVTWWECLLPMLPVFIIVPLVKLAGEKQQVTDHERHGGWVVEARYYEDWDEWITETCSYTVSCGKDCTTTVYYDCSYRRYHPAEWHLTDSNGYEMPISSEEFEALAAKFHSRHKIDQHRSYYTKDGDMFRATWPGDVKTQTPVATEHWFENRVQNAVGVYAYDKVHEPHKRGIYDYPKLHSYLYDPAILGNADNVQEADRELQLLNGQLGRKKQVRMWILLFHGQDRSVGLEQEAHWKGGKKNEVVTCINLDPSGKPTWCHVFCWSPDGNTSNHEMKANIRNAVEFQTKLDLKGTVKLIGEQVQQHFVRKSFKEFSYLAVATPTWAYWVIYLLVIASTGGLGWFAVVNEYTLRNDPFSESLGLETRNGLQEPGIRDWFERAVERSRQYLASKKGGKETADAGSRRERDCDAYAERTGRQMPPRGDAKAADRAGRRDHKRELRGGLFDRDDDT